MPGLSTIVLTQQTAAYTYHLDSAATTNPVLIKSGPGVLVGWYVANTNAAARYLAFHDIYKTPLAGRDIAWKMGIPASGAANAFPPIGIGFTNGLAITTVVNPIDNDASAVAIHDLIINLFYR